MRVLFGLIAIVVLVTILNSQSTDTPKATLPFEQAGYFKSPTRDRIYTILVKSPVDESAIVNHARGLQSTPGQMTAAYYYYIGDTVPRDGVTLAISVFEANKVIFDMPGISRPSYAYMRFRNGTDGLTPCYKLPMHELCRSN